VSAEGLHVPPVHARLSVDRLRICRAGTDVDVVDDVSFSVSAGDVIGLVGESGSGKTTVALALMAYARRGLEIRAGAVVVDGVDALSLAPRALRHLRGGTVAYVPQDPGSALNPSLRIRTQLVQALKAHADGEEDIDARLDAVLEEVNLPSSLGALQRYPHQLSGGQQQRVALALAFLCRPSLIILDEPTTGLDVSTQRHVLGTVRNLCSAYGVAAVFVSHDLAVVSGLATSVAVMYAGRIVELGQTDSVFGEPTHPYTQGLLDALPSPTRTEILHGIDGQPPQPGRRPRGCSFAPRCALRIARCETEAPPVTSVAGRLVRCFRAGEAVTARTADVTAEDAAPVRREAILRIGDVRARYGQLEVLHGVSFDVPRSACVALVGESGSGKTTLAGCISGLHRDFSGSIAFRDDPLASGTSDRSRTTLREIQYVFQNPYASLNPRKTVGQIIAQPLEHHFDLGRREREARVEQILDDVALARDFVSRFPDQLSGGERQRVAIARALVVDPVLLICDEVTSALDVSVQAVIVELLRRLQAERDLTMLFVTHNLALVRSIAHEVVVVADGNVIECGPVAEILDHPKQPYTVRLIEDIPRLEAARA
jgi:peptide/nickel transport system ATP-binding protein